jgi:DHA2 family multidrug resistance protein
VEAVVCVVAFSYFIIHTWSAPEGQSFLSRTLLRDRNFVTGTLFIFVVGMILYATMALLPTLLQSLLDYPVVFTGEVMAPRGVGTMLAMMLVGRMVHRFDPRLIMAGGFLLTALSLYQMAGITPDMGSSTIVVSGFIQGAGLGFTFVPLSMVTFATLAPQLRNEGTPIYSLMRNIGSSVGISLVQMLLTEDTARAHAVLGEHVALGNPLLQTLPAALSPFTEQGRALLNLEVTRQAALVAYIDDFKLMMWLSLAVLPLLLFIRRPAESVAAGGADSAH